MLDTEIRCDVLHITISHPPVNALGEAVRNDLMQAVIGARHDPAISAIVIRGDGAIFSAGADIGEFGRLSVAPQLAELVDAIEASDKPVVAAIDGLALGGGLEVALGCHYRIAVPEAKLGLPEVRLGLVPGAGGTQRLPRLIGAEAALDMIVTGDAVSASRALELGLVDEIVAGEELEARAIACARSIRNLRRLRDQAVTADPAIFDDFVTRNRRRIDGQEGPMACLQAVKAAVELPFDEGARKERALFGQLLSGDQSKALRHAFFAERAAAKIDNMPADARPRAIGRVGVMGAGTMGGGIAMNFLSAGIPVTIVEMAPEPLDRGTGIMRSNYEATAARGRITVDQAERAMNLLTPTLDFAALAECDLVIEAVYEDMDLKKRIFGQLDGVARPGAVLASNTSFLSIDEIAAATCRPEDVIGLHFFSPANVMKLVEVVRGARTRPDVLATGMEVARRIGKVPVVAGVCYGFIGNRMLIPRQGQALQLLLEGATPEQVDRVHTAFGMPMGPFQMSDLAGVDVGWHRDPARIESIPDALCAARRWGQKTRAGYYDYDDRRRPSPSAVTQGIIEDFRTRAGITPRDIGEDEIVVRTLYTMVNEGALILEGGFAQRASDIDVVWLHGYGWPRHKGGPMFWAGQVGLDAILAGFARYADRLGDDFVVSALLERRAKNGAPLDR